MFRQCTSRVSVRGLASPARTLHRISRPLQSKRTLASVKVPPQQEPTDLDQVSTLPNGIRVASDARANSFSGVGVYVEAGSRFENDYLRGVSHLIDRTAFHSTENQSAEDIKNAFDALGGNIHCVSSRESVMYQAATFNSALPQATALLADTIRYPKLSDEEVEGELQTALYEVTEIFKRPDLIIPELVHTAAYKDNTLGNPLLCPADRLQVIDQSHIRAYRRAFYRPERTVVAFSGIPHEEALKLATDNFGGIGPSIESQPGSDPWLDSMSSSSEDSRASSPTWSDSVSSDASSTTSASSSQKSSGLLSKIPVFKNLSTSAARNATITDTNMALPTSKELQQPAKYTGGFMRLPTARSTNPNTPQFSHIHLAFEGVPISHDDIYALATLNTLLGGGGSFSAGGPGKGMYSRLFTNVLNQHAWVENCVAFNHSYTDSGLFGIAAQCIPGRTQHMLDVMCQQLRALTLDTGFSALQQLEVDRAKNQLRSSLLMNLESRMVQLEDLGRQVQIYGRNVPVLEMCRKIESLTVADLRRVASQVVGGEVMNAGGGSGAPTVVLQEAPLQFSQREMSWEEIEDRIYKWGLGRR